MINFLFYEDAHTDAIREDNFDRKVYNGYFNGYIKDYCFQVLREQKKNIGTAVHNSTSSFYIRPSCGQARSCVLDVVNKGTCRACGRIWNMKAKKVTRLARKIGRRRIT